ncbi:hypothetical protein [Cellulomonas sp. ATA003]|uniref:hypothetical protein n=1 Tax=Cellulomonas sp. ATA003 TaxID=3073064 RepID=UPI0028731268|nr:hypothetical protein [Cellulomonas sp. ATA003]WNB86208.1 hypothetical protein REH70_02760 [Cellulomonas sp. ATA003]
MTTVSVVRGAWEVRLVRVRDASPEAVALRIGGWPLAGSTTPEDAVDAAGRSAVVRCGRLTSVVSGSLGLTAAGVERSTDASPLGDVTATPWLQGPVPDDWVAAVIGLSGRPAGPGAVEPAVRVDDAAGASGPRATVTWGDGAVTDVALPTGGGDA